MTLINSYGYQARIQRGGGGGVDLSSLNFLEVKIIKNINGKKRLALKFSQEIRMETRDF